MRATQHVLDLLDRGELETFLFDGQTVVLEDVSEVLSPEDRARLSSHIRRGRIEVGPWYVLPDEFLVSGEALVRNLHMGMSDAEVWGSEPTCAYLPDLFGHISQIPQLAREVGLSHALIFRGADAQAVSVVWQAADNTAVPTHVLPLFSGYFNPFLNEENFEETFMQFVSDMEPHVASDEPIVLLAGADHTAPPADWSQRLSRVATIVQDATEPRRVEQCSLSTALSAVDAHFSGGGSSRAAIHGEQRNNRRTFVLGGILSSRQYLKRLNRAAEELLTGVVEPLTLFAHSTDVQPHFIRTLWRQLLRNQPHDSIGGCSIDEVHRANVARFEDLLAAGRRYVHDILRRLTSPEPEGLQSSVTLFNLLPYAEDERVVEIEIDVPGARDLGDLRLLRDGQPLAYDVLSRTYHEGFSSEMERAPTWTPSVRYRIATRLSFDGISSQVLSVEPTESRSTPAPSPAPEASSGSGTAADPALDGAAAIANERIVLSVLPSGSVEVTDHATGGTVRDAVAPFHQPDDGDSYTCVPGTAIRWRFSAATEARHGQFLSSITLFYDGPAESRLALHLSVRTGEPVFRVRAEIFNAAENVRYQLRFALPHRTTRHFSDTPFDVVERAPGRPRWHYTAPRTEAPESGLPTSSFVWAAGVMVAHDGLHEYECDGNAIYSTLLRATGELSKYALPTPEGQCYGILSAELAFAFCELHEAAPLSRRFLQPVVAAQGTNGAPRSTILKIDNLRVVMSALYSYEPGIWICRLWNPTDEPQPLALHSSEGRAWHRISMADERRLAWVGPTSRSPEASSPTRAGRPWGRPLASLTMRPKEIATLTLTGERS
jgi:hypothetical protein